MIRLTLVSDPTKKCPEKTSSEFEVRLAQPLALPGEGWQVTLASLSTPDATMDLSRLTKGTAVPPFTLAYREADIPGISRVWHSTSANLEAFNAIYDGVSLMKTVIFQFEKFAHVTNQSVRKSLKLKYMPEFQWSGDVLEMIPKKLTDIQYSGGTYLAFQGDLSLAKEMDWVRYNATSRRYDLGGNLRPKMEWIWASEEYTPVFNTELDRQDIWWVINDEKTLALSMTVGWAFINLNLAFRNVVGQPFLVYSDVVDSNQVGAQLHPLLREVEYRRQGAGVAYFEPTHHQWMPCRREYLDIVEVSVSESHGGLVKFGPGRTIVTLLFKRDV